MAQVREHEGLIERLRRLLRQRPAAVAAVALLMGCCAGAALFGVGQAAEEQGVVLERGSSEAVGEAEASRTGDGESGERADDGSDGSASTDAGEGGPIVVDVAGAVATPGVFELPDGSRVQDAIAAAGGLVADADPSRVNRAAPVADGQQVYIPRAGEAPAAGQGTGAAPASGSSAAASSLVNINSATAEELDALPGVGPSTAQAIIEDREANGPFAAVEDLMRVSGIGEKKFEKLKASICV